jgi:hypothetical protein
MATLPTRRQQQASDLLAEALYRITEASRLDAKGKLDRADLAELARLIGQASSAFSLDQIVTRALELKAKGCGIAQIEIDMITLMDVEVTPINMLLLNDDEFKDLVARMEDELGGP